MARMSPSAQTNSRKLLEQQMAQSMTGDADVDSLIAQELRRKMTFAAPEHGKAAPGGASMFDKLVALFRGKKPAKR